MKKSLLALISLSSVLMVCSCGDPIESTPDVIPSEKPSTPEASIPEVSTPEASTPEVSTPEASTPESSTPEVNLPTDKTPTIFLAGDSTVRTYNDNQYIAGWGQYLDLFLNEQIEVVNCANGGRSSRSFINEGRLFNIDDSEFNYSFSQNDGNSIEDCIEEGDYLFVQFGHNDDDSKKASQYTTMYDRMVPLGTPDANGIYPTTAANKVSTDTLPSEYVDVASSSEESKALDEIAKYGSTYYSYDCGGTYKWYLKQYIDFARSKNAIPVLITPVARVKFSGEEIIGGPGLHGEDFAYVKAVRQLAEEEDCLLIDLFAESKEILETATSEYANYLMALKPNDLVGEWPKGYDSTYGQSSLGYTGIEATHYNKYGAFLQAGKVVENIIRYDGNLSSGEYYNFTSHVLSAPESYVNHSNLLSKAKAAAIEDLFELVNVTDPTREYIDPALIVGLINDLQDSGEVSATNYLDIKVACENIRAQYYGVNVDDRAAITNIAVLEQYEADVKAQEEANRPKPTSTDIYHFNDETIRTITTTEQIGELTIVATSDKKVDVKKASASFTHNGETYEAINAISLGGGASFGSNRYIEFSVDGACQVTVVAKSSGSSDRILDLRNSSNESVGKADAKASVSITTISLEEAGTYMLGSTGSGIYVYYIIVDYYN